MSRNSRTRCSLPKRPAFIMFLIRCLVSNVNRSEKRFDTAARMEELSRIQKHWHESNPWPFLRPGPMFGSVQMQMDICKLPDEMTKGENSIATIRAGAKYVTKPNTQQWWPLQKPCPGFAGELSGI